MSSVRLDQRISDRQSSFFSRKYRRILSVEIRLIPVSITGLADSDVAVFLLFSADFYRVLTVLITGDLFLDRDIFLSQIVS